MNWGVNCKPTLEGFRTQSSKGFHEQEQGVGCKLVVQKSSFVFKTKLWFRVRGDYKTLETLPESCAVVGGRPPKSS